MDRETTRQRLADELRSGARTPSELAAAVDTTPAAAVEHVKHLARSLGPTEERLLVAPPACRRCGFDGFDDPVNVPSRCPSCRSEAIDEPSFVVE